MKYPKISIIILNWNGLKDTIECLESLKKITYPNYKVIIVDNGSKNNEGKILKEKFGDYIHLIQNKKNLGFAAGNNIGIRYAFKDNTDYIVLLNNDTTVEKNFLDEGVKILENDQKIGFCVPKITIRSTNQIWWSGARFLKGKNNLLNLKFLITEHSINNHNAYFTDCATGCALFMRAKILDKIGLLDEKFFMYGEDIDWSLRLRRQGYKIFYFNTTIVHHFINSNICLKKRLRNLLWILQATFKLVNRYYNNLEKLIWWIKLPITIPLTFLSAIFPDIHFSLIRHSS